ncbi:hypothetical protein DYBT9275_01511 [Dyadobacter sp. CECT 9275]|uniref:Heptosyltransferase-3 n=1 Tax=Dyadobacter helix TaxID=2822344 RepID=A0A916N3H0_9BACT|nr:glycosyltransferase family 9 protein [Dyadobacter sp. CECT 9275]CAG4994977.1 hypothetical protein DYBT9275_01511 [Dyadobacter sp. CECT 9275]
MTLDRFIQLWTHRYHKSCHIFKAYFLGYSAAFHFLWRKLFFKKGKDLIGIVRTEHFGDIVAVEPISRYVRSLYPDAHIVWFVKPVFRELVANNPSVNEVFPEFCISERKALLSLGVFDKIFELQFRNNNYCPKCQVFKENPIAQQRNINVYNYFNYGNLLEVFAQSGDLIAPNAVFPADDQPKLYLTDDHRKKVEKLALTKPYLVLHCQSNYILKDWPADKWNQLVAWMAEKYDYQMVEVGLKSNLTVATDKYQNLCGQLSILETAEVIRNAAFFIGLDSGPSHLANAVGTYGMILMGSLNDFPTYNPYSGGYGRQDNAVFIRQEGEVCANLSFDFVQNKIEAVLDHSAHGV